MNHLAFLGGDDGAGLCRGAGGGREVELGSTS